MAEHADAAGIGPHAARDAANQRGFARAIGAEQAETCALMDFERNAGHARSDRRSALRRSRFAEECEILQLGLVQPLDCRYSLLTKGTVLAHKILRSKSMACYKRKLSFWTRFYFTPK